MPRTLVKTATAGWFINAADPEGGKVRKTDGDVIIDQAEFEQRQLDAEDGKLSNGGEPENTLPETALTTDADAAKARREQQVPPEGQTTVVADTGKLLVGKTTTITCRWVDTDAQNAKVKKLYAKDQRQVTPKQVEKAAGAKTCGVKRVIKVQDEFQAKFCVAHQDENRKTIRREKARAKRKAKS